MLVERLISGGSFLYTVDFVYMLHVRTSVYKTILYTFVVLVILPPLVTSAVPIRQRGGVLCFWKYFGCYHVK